MPTRPIDGAIAGFVARAIDSFAGLIASDSLLSELLASMGYDEAAIAPTLAYVRAQASDVQRVATVAPALITAITASDPDLAAVVSEIETIWQVVQRLAGSAPAVPPAPTLQPVKVIEVLLDRAIETAVRESGPLTWSVLSALGLVGANRTMIDAFGEALSNPLTYAFSRATELRREMTIGLAGLRSGPRTSSLAHAALGASLPVAAVVKAVTPDAEVVVQRVRLGIAADTFDEPFRITADVLATADGRFAGLAVHTDALPRPDAATRRSPQPRIAAKRGHPRRGSHRLWSHRAPCPGNPDADAAFEL